jgi:hypothetical protein
MFSQNSSESKRIIYFGFSDERQFIVDFLHAKYQWEPVALIGASRSQSWSEENYPEALYLNPMQLRKGQFDYSKVGEPIPIDSQVIHRLSKYEKNFLQILEDPTGWNYSFLERKTFYFEVLRFWHTVINNLKPDIFVSWTWPHTSMCYPLYLMCKYQWNVDVIFGSPVPLFNNNYHLIGTTLDDYCNPHDPVNELYQSGKEITPKPDVMEYLLELRSDQARIPKPIVDRYEQDSWDNSTSFRLKHFLRLVMATLVKGTGFKESPTSWKKNKKPYYMSDSVMNKFQYFLFVEKIRNKNRGLKKSYVSLCVVPDFERNYVYFAAPYQPEAVTATNAGVYDDLFLVLDILASVLPDNWIIYYKEHPNTFSRATWAKGALRRDRYYYERLIVNEKIQLVNSEIETFRLIDNAKVVATVSGSVAWEAAVRGRPALSFGVAWYMGCKSIFKIETLQDAKTAMEKILNGYLPDQADVDRYANAIAQVGVKGMIHHDFHWRIKECSNPRYEMERMAEALYLANEQWHKH